MWDCIWRRMVVEMTTFRKWSAFILLVILINRAAATDFSLLSEVKDAPSSEIGCSRSDPSMDPFYEIRYGQDVVWQIPTNPKAVIFLAHGKDREPLSYFDSAPHCRQCYGLPEDRGAVLAAIARDYAVIMVKSVTSYWQPWGVEVWPPPASNDRTIVASIVKEWTKEHSLDHLPLAAFGYSSGGNFSTLLTQDLDIKSLVLLCSPGERLALLNADASFPPILFLDMPRDKSGFYAQVLENLPILESKGVRTGHIDIAPRPIRPSNFSDKIPCIEQKTGEAIYEAFKAENWLDDYDYVSENPIAFDAAAVLLKHQALPFCPKTNDVCFAKHVQQEISVAYAVHSFTSEYNKEIFDWFDETVFLSSSDPAGSWSSQ